MPIVADVNFDDQLHRYFGTPDVSEVTPAVLAAGVERMKVDLGLEKDPSRRFALWAILHMLGDAPDLDAAFANEAEHEAARNFMDLADQAERQ